MRSPARSGHSISVDRVFGQHLVPADVRQLEWTAQAIQIDVIHHASRRRIPVDERNVGLVTSSVTPSRDRWRAQASSSLPQLAGQADDQRRRRRAPESLTPSDELRFVEREVAVTRHVWGGLDGTGRNLVNKSRKLGVTVANEGEAALAEFERLHDATIARLVSGAAMWSPRTTRLPSGTRSGC